jgi:hypothetical protein
MYVAEIELPPFRAIGQKRALAIAVRLNAAGDLKTSAL